MAFPHDGRKFKPGQSGNPAGKPPGIPNARTRYKRFLELVETVKNPVTGADENMTVAEVLDLMQISKARKGDTRSYQEVMDRLEGRAQQSMDITSDGDKIEPIVIYRPEKLKEGDDNGS